MSKTTNRINKVSTKLSQILFEKVEYRDNDAALVCRVWWDELPDKDMSARRFLELYKLGCFTHADTITRARRKLQEDFPLLRGEAYNDRHKDDLDTRSDI